MESESPGYFFGFAFFTAEFLAPFFALLFESPAAPSPLLRPAEARASILLYARPTL